MRVLYALALSTMMFRVPVTTVPVYDGPAFSPAVMSHPWVLWTPWKSETEHDVHDHAAE